MCVCVCVCARARMRAFAVLDGEVKAIESPEDCNVF